MPPDPTIWGALREATQERHGAIESLLRLDACLPLPRYRRVLSGFESFLSAWEPHVRGALPAALAAGFEGRSRLPFVRADLRALDEPAGEPLRGLDDALPLPDTAAALGSMYVLEGSALGGQVIARQVRDRFGFSPAHGAAYFHGWGEATGRHWREFRELLAAEVPAGAASDSACEAACRTFDLLIDTFTLHLHESAAA